MIPVADIEMLTHPYCVWITIIRRHTMRNMSDLQFWRSVAETTSRKIITVKGEKC